METRPLTVQIPAPRGLGVCNTACPLFEPNVADILRIRCALQLDDPDAVPMKPGPRCPWYEDKEARNAKA